MTSFFAVAYNVLVPIFLIVGLAVLLDRRFAPDPRVFSRVVIYLFSPCLVFSGIARSDLQIGEMGLININEIALPLPLQRAVELLGQAAVPCMLVILGTQLSRTSVKGRVWPILLATGTRLLVAPLIAILLIGLVVLPGLARQVFVIEASMPTATLEWGFQGTAGVLATEFGGDAEFTTAVILVSTLASIITLSVLLTPQ